MGRISEQQKHLSHTHVSLYLYLKGILVMSDFVFMLSHFFFFFYWFGIFSQSVEEDKHTQPRKCDHLTSFLGLSVDQQSIAFLSHYCCNPKKAGSTIIYTTVTESLQ